MPTYIDRDIGLTFDGDIELSDGGDLKLANALETHKSAANFVLRTDYGDYQPDIDVGCNLGSYIGDLNTTNTHASMEASVSRAIKNEIFSPADVQVNVVPFDIEEALVIVNLAGFFLIDGEEVYVEQDRISYSFPFIDANPTPLVI